MAIPTIVGTSTENTSASSLTVVYPTGYQADDVLFCFVLTTIGESLQTTLSQTPKFIAASDSGWTLGGDVSVTNKHIYVYWKRATSGAEADVQTSDPGTQVWYGCVALRGALASGDPIEGYTEGTGGLATNVQTLGAVTTTGPDRIILGACACMVDTTGDRYSAWTNANLADPTPTEQFDIFSDVGTNPTPGGLGGYAGGFASDSDGGDTGSTTASITASVGALWMHFAVQPESGAAPQELRPDADLATTGWTSTPLHSKLSDESDATVVTATLG